MCYANFHLKSNKTLFTSKLLQLAKQSTNTYTESMITVHRALESFTHLHRILIYVVKQIFLDFIFITPAVICTSLLLSC